MNKTNKRYMNLRNKLFAAIAMLLVSSIMMVSSTYAWFTLSTAPEVQGITTTVGANGNLEIALSPADGDSANIGSAMGDSTKEWTVKNLTWGNLLDLSSTSYGLEAITLLPARLNLGAVATAPLKTPVYGADGRIEKLEANTRIAQPVQEAKGYVYNVSETFRGVRAVGTSSSLTKYQITFNNYLASMAQNASAARDLAEVSLKNNGAQLANMAVAHATAGSGDTNTYGAYKSAMNDVITNLRNSSAKLKAAIYDAVVTAAASNPMNGDTQLNSEEAYNGVMALVEANATLEALLVKTGKATWVDETKNTITVTGTDNISVAYTKWATIETNLSYAKTEYDKLSDAPTWTEASNVLGYLMDTDGIKMNGYELSEFKTYAQRYVSAPKEGSDTWQKYYTDTDGDGTVTVADAEPQYEEAKKVMSPFTQGKGEMQLGTGSGVYAEIAYMVGNLSAPIEIDIDYDGMSLSDVPITIKTNTANPADTGYMGTVRTVLATIGAFQDANADLTGVLNETYGYIVDFFFRTNATGSSLLLQSDPAQRVYSDATSGETLGNGSSMTFRSGNINANAVENLMKCIRVVFLDTENYNVLGIAALDMVNATTKVVTAGTDGAADIVDITAKLYLHEYSENATTGALTLGAAKTAKADTALCELPTNTAKAVSVMVYLDGDNVTNADVANAATSTTGTLNLQFASDETLVPMDNESLKNMAESTKYNISVQNTSGAIVNTSSSTVKDSTAYNFNINGSDYAVSYKVGTGEATTINPTSTNGTVNYYQIPAADVKGDITIIVTSTATGGDSGDDESEQTTYTVTVTADGAAVDGAPTSTTAEQDFSYTVADYANKTVVVAIDGETAAVGTDYTYNDGVIGIPYQHITGNITITITTTPAEGG